MQIRKTIGLITTLALVALSLPVTAQNASAPTLSADDRLRLDALLKQIRRHQESAATKERLESINRGSTEYGAGAVLQDGRAQQANAQVMVFVTLDMPDTSLVQWLNQARAAQAPVAVRGFYGGTMKTMLKRVSELPAELSGGLMIAPMAFRRLEVRRVPTVVAMAAPLSVCETQHCAGDPVPAHDRVVGNIGLPAALEIMIAEGDAGQSAARVALARLRETEGGM